MRPPFAAGAAAALSLFLLVLLDGCASPRVFWSQRVNLNGRTLVFARLNTLSPGPAGHRIEYRDGDFFVTGAGPLAVNGFEITTLDGAVTLANQRVELAPGEEVHFKSDMSWVVRQGQRPAAAEKAAPRGAR